MSLRLTKMPRCRVRVWFTNKDRKNFICNEAVEYSDTVHLYTYKNNERIIIGKELKEECIEKDISLSLDKIKKYSIRTITDNGESAHVQVVHVN